MSLFEDRTFQNILGELLKAAPEGVDTRQGSIYYDAVVPCALKMAAIYVDIRLIGDLLALPTATGEYLDRKGEEYKVYRNGATPAKYLLDYYGLPPRAGARFFSENLYFFVEVLDGTYYLVSELAGEAANTIVEGTRATPLNTVKGLKTAKFGALIEYGQDTESDDDYRKRIQDKLGGPARNGNRHHYKSWCEDVDGVGRARIVPLWAGENTVKGILLDPNGLPAPETIVVRVQDYVDPGGTGLGEGVANIGAHFTAVAATKLSISVSADITVSDGYTLTDIRAAAETSIRDYLKGIALDTPESEQMVVRVSSIGALIHAVPGVVDYTNLQVNAGTANISVPGDHAAVLEEVSFSGSV